MKINFTRVLLFLIAIFVLSVFLFSLNKINIYDTKNLIGQNIKSFEIKSFKDEKIISEKNLKENKYTLINFWASWCAPCRKEHKNLLFLKKNGDIKILGVNFKDKKSNANKFINDLGNPFYLIALDEDGKKSVSFGVYGIPETILINQDLVVVKKYIGAIDKKDVKEILKIVGKK